MRLLRSNPDVGKLRQTLLLVWESSPRWTVVNISLLLVQTGISLSALYLLKLWVDAVTLSLGRSDPLHALRHVGLLIVSALLLALLGNVTAVSFDVVNRAQSQAKPQPFQSPLPQQGGKVGFYA